MNPASSANPIWNHLIRRECTDENCCAQSPASETSDSLRAARWTSTGPAGGSSLWFGFAAEADMPMS